MKKTMSLDSLRNMSAITTVMPSVTTVTLTPTASVNRTVNPMVMSAIFVYGFLIFIIDLGNITVLRMVMVMKKKRTYFLLLMSLALADLLVGLIVLPVRLCEVLGAPLTRYMSYCRVSHCLTLLSLSASILNLFIIAIDRFIAVTSPLKAKTIMTRERAIVACITVWTVAILFSLLPVLGVGDKGGTGLKPTAGLCMFKDTMDSRYLAVFFFLILMVPSIVIPLLQVYMIFYIKAYFGRRQEFIRTQSCSTKSFSRETKLLQKEIKLMNLFRTITVLFYICWGPFVVGVILSVVSPGKVQTLLVFLLSIAVFANSAVNPIVYIIYSKNLKKIMIRWLPTWLSSCCSKEKEAIPAEVGLQNVTRSTNAEQNDQGMDNEACEIEPNYVNKTPENCQNVC